MSTRLIYASISGSIIATLVLDLLFSAKLDGSILLSILFWAAVGQGIIALSAASDLAKGRWIKIIQPYLQQYYHLLVLFPVTFLIFCRHVPVYKWSSGSNSSFWLTPAFFIIRNTIFLILPFVIAHFYIRLSQKDSGKKGMLALLYIFVFVLSQSFLAYDVVMTFDFPWINTLFGGYFFVESLYAGIAFCAVLSGILASRQPNRFANTFRDFTVMLMGFALLWVGLFFSQYLVIWYGNIPEEVSYITRRLAIPGVSLIGILILFLLFVIPFFSLISRKIKSSQSLVSLIAVMVMSGIVIERMIFLLPVAYLDPVVSIFSLISIGLPFGIVLFNQARSVQAGQG